MTIKDFVKAIKMQTSDAAVAGTVQCLKEPPGRKPRPKLLMLSEWYTQLDTKDQEIVREALKEAAEMAVFEFFCVLDGVSVIEDTPHKGELELYFLKGTEQTRLNDPRQEELHNIFNALCEESTYSSDRNPQILPYDSGEAQELKSKMMTGDDLDIHHVPDKYSSVRSIEEYDPKTGLAIVIPKVEHRQIPPSR